jgi:hypothetical protein
VGEGASEPIELPHHERIARLQGFQARGEPGPRVLPAGGVILVESLGRDPGRHEGIPLEVEGLVVYLSPADKYHRLTRRLSQRAKRPKRESSHGLSAALSPLVTPSKPAVRTHVAGSGSLSLPLPTTVACSYPH